MSAFFNQLCCFGNPEVFGDLRDRGFVLTRDRNYITANSARKGLGVVTDTLASGPVHTKTGIPAEGLHPDADRASRR
jgi:hypothetical protein